MIRHVLTSHPRCRTNRSWLNRLPLHRVCEISLLLGLASCRYRHAGVAPHAADVRCSGVARRISAFRKKIARAVNCCETIGDDPFIS